MQPFTFIGGLHPSVSIDVTTPDGQKRSQKFTKFSKDEVSLSREGCDVRFGPHLFQGDLKDYRIKADPVDGLGFDLRLHSTASPWRGETGYIGFGDHDEKYFTWTCAVPRGVVEGTITVDGVEHKATGAGYHDHQWGNTVQFEFLNNWLWARQSTSEHTIVTFDFIMNQRYDHTRIPLFFVQDNEGKVVFDCSRADQVSCEVLEEQWQEASKTDFPKVTRYTFHDGEKTCAYTLSVEQELDGRDIYHSVPAPMRLMFKGSKPKYGRYLADGQMVLDDGKGNVVRDGGELIYEFAYVQDSYRELMDTTVAKDR